MSCRLDAKPWTDEECRRAAAYYREFEALEKRGGAVPYGMRRQVFARVAAAIGRSKNAVETRFRDRGPGFGASDLAAPPRPGRKVSTEALAERAARLAASDRQSLTGRIVGDPPPGFSMLDRKQTEQSR